MIHEFHKQKAFTTAKEHKANFLNNPHDRLLDSTKNNIDINKSLTEHIDMPNKMAWELTSGTKQTEAILWFTNTFIQFDIFDFTCSSPRICRCCLSIWQ